MGSHKSSAMACTGKYKLTKSENFEDFMKALGVGMVTRKLGNKTSPTITVTEENTLIELLLIQVSQGNSLMFQCGSVLVSSFGNLGCCIISNMRVQGGNQHQGLVQQAVDLLPFGCRCDAHHTVVGEGLTRV